MSTDSDELLRVLYEIRDLLVPISACFEDKYSAVQRKAKKVESFKATLTPVRQRIYPLLFDARHLSQIEIAKEVDTTQPTVSKFVNMLLEQGLIGQFNNEDGMATYQDKYSLLDVLQNMEEK